MNLLKFAVLPFIVPLVFLPLLARAFPLPYQSPDLGAPKDLFRSQLGYSIHSKGTEWKRHKPLEADAALEVFFQPQTDPTNTQASLTVRSHLLPKPTTLKRYMRHWRKHYPRLGFRVLEGKRVRVQDNVGYLIDMVHPDRKKQLRQVVFVKGRVAVTLTCQNIKEQFAETLRPCNQIVRNFTWSQNLH